MNIDYLKLSEIADIQVGYQARGKIEENLDGDFTIIRPQDFSDEGCLRCDEAMRFSSSSKVDAQKYLITAGDVLFQARGHNHLSYLIEEPLEKAVAANTFYIIRLKEHEKVLPAYLTWWIKQADVQTYFKQEQVVSTIPFISKAVLLNTRIRIPPIEIQAKISKLMQLWQRDKELARQLTKKKEILINTVARKATINPQEVK